jgi:hypothetical protein
VYHIIINNEWQKLHRQSQTMTMLFSCLITDINHSNGTEVWAYVISLSLPHFIEVPVPMQVNE